MLFRSYELLMPPVHSTTDASTFVSTACDADLDGLCDPELHFEGLWLQMFHWSAQVLIGLCAKQKQCSTSS